MIEAMESNDHKSKVNPKWQWLTSVDLNRVASKVGDKMHKIIVGDKTHAHLYRRKCIANVFIGIPTDETNFQIIIVLTSNISNAFI